MDAGMGSAASQSAIGMFGGKRAGSAPDRGSPFGFIKGRAGAGMAFMTVTILASCKFSENNLL